MKLIYVGDPLCSWCYGFGKELAALLEAVPDVGLDIVVGGLRAGGTEVLDEAGKQFRLHHWARVEAASGLPFNREAFVARQGFVYDTEPVCRAVVTARLMGPEVPLLPVFSRLQHAFYVQGLDTTDPDVLSGLVAQALSDAGHACDLLDVQAAFHAPATLEATRADFAKARRWGVASFPTLLLEHRQQLRTVASGYAGVAALRRQVEALVGDGA